MAKSSPPSDIEKYLTQGDRIINDAFICKLAGWKMGEDLVQPQDAFAYLIRYDDGSMTFQVSYVERLMNLMNAYRDIAVCANGVNYTTGERLQALSRYAELQMGVTQHLNKITQRVQHSLERIKYDRSHLSALFGT
jgi:hypothetical protein